MIAQACQSQGNASTVKLNRYSEKPLRFKLNDAQYYAMFPFHLTFGSLHGSFVAEEKREVVVELSSFRKYVHHHIAGQSEFTFGQGLYTKAIGLSPLFQVLEVQLNKLLRSGNKTMLECRSNMSQEFLSSVGRIIENKKVKFNLAELWYSFLINVAMLNIKSLVLCAEACVKYKKKFVPIKFIPRLGPELELIYGTGGLIIGEDFKLGCGRKYVSAVSENIFIDTLPVSSIEILSACSCGNYNIDPFSEMESRGYPVAGFNEILADILSVSTGTSDELKDCNDYLAEIEELVFALAGLARFLDHTNSKAKGALFLLDLDFNKNYDYSKISM